MGKTAKQSYEFGPFRLIPDERQLLRDGEPVALTPKGLDLLVVLVENAGHLIEKGELLNRVWPDSFVEEGNLTVKMSELRRALGRTADGAHYVETVPRSGYRFVASVTSNNDEVPETPVVQVDDDEKVGEPSPPSPEPRPPSGSRRWVYALIGVAVVCVLLVGLNAGGLRDRIFPIAAGPTAIRSLAVLPLENLSGDASQDYFAEGMTEALITDLAKIHELRVISRPSVIQYKGTRKPVPEIARELNVDAVLTGSVVRAGERVRIAVQLIHAATDAHLWSRDYERELTDVLKLQSDVARAVADEVQARVTAEERARLASAGSVTPAAYQEFLLGQHYLWRLNEEDLARAIGHFEQSLRLDPNSAAVYAGLSHAWWWRGIWGATTFKQVESPSRAAAVKALELDPGLPEAHVSMGRLKFGHEWDWSGAERAFSRALAIDPNNVDAHFFSAMLCMAIGCFPDAIDHMKRIEERDPLSSTVQSFFGRVLYRARRYDEAMVHLNRAIELDPQSPAGAYGRLADVYEAVGKYDEALMLLEKAASIEGRRRDANETVAAARIYALMGKRKEAIGMLKGSRGSNPHMLAMAYTALGDHDEAFRLLFRIIEDPSFNVYVKTDPAFDPLHDDPRWREVLRRMNYPTETNAGSRDSR